MNHPDTLDRARAQLPRIVAATSHGAAEIAYDVACGWFAALLAEQLIDAPQHAALTAELKAAQQQSDERLRAVDAAYSASHHSE
jgi:hypothetical protein